MTIPSNYFHFLSSMTFPLSEKAFGSLDIFINTIVLLIFRCINWNSRPVPIQVNKSNNIILRLFLFFLLAIVIVSKVAFRIIIEERNWRVGRAVSSNFKQTFRNCYLLRLCLLRGLVKRLVFSAITTQLECSNLSNVLMELEPKCSIITSFTT